MCVYMYMYMCVHVCVYVATRVCVCVCCVGIDSAEEQEGAHSSEADAGCASGYAGEPEFDPNVENSSIIVEESDVDSDSCSGINATLIDEVQFLWRRSYSSQSGLTRTIQGTTHG